MNGAIKVKVGAPDIVRVKMGEAKFMVVSDNAHRLFWNNYLNGSNFQYAFAGSHWTDETFNPPMRIDLSGNNASYMFYKSGVRKSPHLFELDFSKCIGAIQIFMGSRVEELGVLNFSSVIAGWGGLNQTFYDCNKLRKIEKLIVPSYSIPINCFNGCSSLEEIRFEGTLFTALDFQQSPLLSNETAQSVIDHLVDLTGKTAQQIKFHADVKAKMTDEQKQQISNKNWTLA